MAAVEDKSPKTASVVKPSDPDPVPPETVKLRYLGTSDRFELEDGESYAYAHGDPVEVSPEFAERVQALPHDSWEKV